MKKSKIIIICFIIVISGVLFNTGLSGIVFASSVTPLATTSPTPPPSMFEATATVDPASIGDTSGVIAIGILVVFIIVAGVIWGSLQSRHESPRNSQPKE